MRFYISQFSCLCKIFNCCIMVTFIVVSHTHLGNCSRIVCLHSFHYAFVTFFFAYSRLSAEWAPIASTAFSMGISTSITNMSAAAWIKCILSWIKRHRQETECALPEMTAVGLSE